MPSYMTHAILADEVGKQINRDFYVDFKQLRTFALGPDLMMVTSYDTYTRNHHENVNSFFYHQIKYIKDHQLQENIDVLMFLFGQITHYVLDSVMHPYIYYMTEKVSDKGKISFHALFEMWLDDYITDEKKIANRYNFAFKGHISGNEMVKYIDTTYDKVYQSKQISKSYKLGIKILSWFERVIRKDQNGNKKKLYKLLDIGDLTISNRDLADYLNSEHRIWLHPVTGKRRNISLEDLYKQALQKSLDLISLVIDCLNDKVSLNYVLSYIEDLSYDTGINCNDKRKMKYFKHPKRKSRKIKY